MVENPAVYAEYEYNRARPEPELCGFRVSGIVDNGKYGFDPLWIDKFEEITDVCRAEELAKQSLMFEAGHCYEDTSHKLVAVKLYELLLDVETNQMFDDNLIAIYVYDMVEERLFELCSEREYDEYWEGLNT